MTARWNVRGMRNIFAIFCLLMLRVVAVKAQVSFQYDLAGNLVTQSNVVAITPPSFQDIGPQYIGANTNGLLTVSALVTGTGPFTYQWLFNGVPIIDATNGSFFLTNATAINLGKYQLVAANSGGAVTSAVVNVSNLDLNDSGLPVAWELAYFGVTGVDPNADPDGDGVSNFLEYLDGTDPTNPNSVRPRLNIPTYLPGGTVSVVPLKSEYQLGDIVQVTAQPGPGFFIDWSGSNAAPVSRSFTNQGASLTLVMNSTIWLTPRFQGPVVVWALGYNVGYNVDKETIVPAGLSNVVALAAGNFFSLAFEGNGTVISWGGSSYGQANVPAEPTGLTNVVAIAAENVSGLALESNGTVVAWGYNGSGQTNVPAGLSNVVAIAGGGYFSLALENNGTVVGWGDNRYGQGTAPAGLSNVVAIAAGYDHTLALTGNGIVAAWGDNSYGETSVPAGLTNVVAIAAGNYFSLALSGNGTVTAWGYNVNGQTNVPAGLSNVVAIAAGQTFSLALQENGNLVAWGYDGYGQTDVPAGLSNVVAIAGGAYLSLASLNDGSPFVTRQPVNITAYSGGVAVLSAGIAGALPLSYQWQLNGTNVAGATNATLVLAGLETNQVDAFRVVVSNLLGTAASASATVTVVNSAPIILLPLVSQAVLDGAPAIFTVQATGSQPLGYQWQFNGTNIPGATQATLDLAAVTASDGGSYQVVVSNAFGTSVSSVAVLTPLNSLVVSWGDNTYGQTNQPADLTNVVAVAGGYDFSLALQANGTVGAWGYNGDGETNVPAGLSNVLAVAAGSFHCLALESNGTVVAWGNNGYGQTKLPAGLSNVVAIAGGQYFSLALQDNGTLAAWGNNSSGQTKVPAGLSNVVAVAAGLYHCLALQGNGTVVAWGDNTYGETHVPADLSNVVAIAAGASCSLALQKNGAVRAWGNNSYGQTNVPAGLSNVVAIAAGPNSGSCLALQGNGTVVAWGDNTFGETNVPSGLRNVVAIATGYNDSLALVRAVAPPVTLALAASIQGDMLVLSFNAAAGSTYTIQSATHLTGGWTTLKNNITGNGAPYQFATPITNSPQLFFRVNQP